MTRYGVYTYSKMWMWIILGLRERGDSCHAFFAGVFDNEDLAKTKCSRLNAEADTPTFEVRRVWMNKTYDYEWSNMDEKSYNEMMEYILGD